MNRKNTYGHAGKTARHVMRVSVMICMIIVLAAGMITPFAITAQAASGLKIRYHQKTRTYTGTKLTAVLDGKSVNLHNTPGLSLKNNKGTTIYMLSVADVFVSGCGVSYSYKNQKITLKKFGKTIRMTLNSKTAYVNNKKVQLEYPPTFVKFYNVNKTKLYVPARFVATTFGYTYDYVRTSSTRVTVKMTTPDYLKYDGKWVKYTKTKAKLSFDGAGVNVSDMYCVVIDSNFYMQAKAFAKAQIGGSYHYSASTKKVTITFGEKTLVMKAGSRNAELNGKKVTLNKPVRLVTNGKTNKEFVMVPVASVAGKFGMNYSYVSRSKTCTIVRKDATYFEWTAPNSEVHASVTVTDEGEEGVVEEPEEEEEQKEFYVINTV